MNIITIIPARYNSSRLPGKMLMEINGKSIIQRTFEQVKKASLIQEVFVATDSKKIMDHCKKFGAACILVDEQCVNGTERVARCLKILNQDCDLVLNVQGDEPFINPDDIDLLITNYQSVVCSTLHYQIKNHEHLHNTNVVKMIVNQNNQVIYGSRGMIPYHKSGNSQPNVKYYAHVGIFLFQKEFLFKFLNNSDTPAQSCEDLEWLKIIEMGEKLTSFEVNEPEIGVNTIEDYNYLSKKYVK